MILAVPNVGSFPTLNLSSRLTQPTVESPAENSPAALGRVDELLLSSVEDVPSIERVRADTRLRSRTQLRIDDDGSTRFKSRTDLRSRYESVKEGSSSERVRADTRLRSRTQLRIDDDGSIRFKSRTQLRYRYEFEAADGTRIQIKAKANLSYDAKLNEDGDLSIKVRAKLQVSFLQESVNSDAGNLLSLGGNDELFAAITEALAAFNDVVTQANSDVLNGEILDGDGLITDLANAFNELADAIDFNQPIALPSTDSPPTDPPPAIDQPADEAAIADSSTAPEPPVTPDVPSQIVVLQETPAAIEQVENTPLAEALAINEPDAAETVETPSDVVADEPASDADETVTDEPTPLAETVDFQSLRLKLQFRFTESLYQLRDLFDGSDDQPRTVTQLNYRLSSHLNLSARFDAADASNPEVPALDTSA